MIREVTTSTGEEEVGGFHGSGGHGRGGGHGEAVPRCSGSVMRLQGCSQVSTHVINDGTLTHFSTCTAWLDLGR